ncbi:MAG TPA: hypothetical protein PLJ60_01050 [Chryseolinea sp.]|nr:hypothetical protein [Chryseolinea sp.]HPH46815.1 hypothetical protein [Chryseolinea sp.]HPM28896.1 hypothetical protein [Chryseolinea sp.]
MNVLVFKTSVESKEGIKRLKPSLDALAGNGQWNFALDDCDKILRIKSQSIHPTVAQKVLHDYGFACSELED